MSSKVERGSVKLDNVKLSAEESVLVVNLQHRLTFC